MPYKVIKRATHSLQFSNDTAYPVPLPTKTIAPIAVSGNSMHIHGKTPRSRRNEQSIHHQLKTNDHSPAKFTETRTVQAQTQSTQTIYRSGDERPAPDTGILYPCQPRQQICPAAADPQRGQERCWRGIGDRNPLSLFNRPREEPIKSTRMTWYSPLVKPIQNP